MGSGDVENMPANKIEPSAWRIRCPLYHEYDFLVFFDEDDAIDQQDTFVAKEVDEQPGPPEISDEEFEKAKEKFPIEPLYTLEEAKQILGL